MMYFTNPCPKVEIIRVGHVARVAAPPVAATPLTAPATDLIEDKLRISRPFIGHFSPIKHSNWLKLNARSALTQALLQS